MKSVIYLLALTLSIPALGGDAMLASNDPNDIIRAIDAAKTQPLMELPWTISDLYIAAKKIEDHPCRHSDGLNSIFTCLWQKLGDGTEVPGNELSIAHALLNNLRAEQVARKAETEARKAEDEDVAGTAPIISFHSELCARGDELLERLNSRRALESLSSGQRFLLNTYLELSLSSNRDEQRKVFCTTNKAALLLKARMQ